MKTGARTQQAAPQAAGPQAQPMQHSPGAITEGEAGKELKISGPRYDLRAVPLFPDERRGASTTIIQRKFALGAVNDRYEREAERVAEQVVGHMREPRAVKGEPQTTPSIQPLAENEARPAPAGFAANIEQARSGGTALPAPLRNALETGFAADLRGVRVHTDARAHSMTQAVQADAFTSERDIFFGHGAYEPASVEGQTLLAHELTHTVQQSSGTAPDQVGMIQRGKKGKKKEKKKDKKPAEEQESSEEEPEKPVVSLSSRRIKRQKGETTPAVPSPFGFTPLVSNLNPITREEGNAPVAPVSQGAPGKEKMDVILPDPRGAPVPTSTTEQPEEDVAPTSDLEQANDGWHDGGEFFPGNDILIQGGKIEAIRDQDDEEDITPWNAQALINRFTLSGDRQEGDQRPWQLEPRKIVQGGAAVRLLQPPEKPDNTVGYLAGVPVPKNQKGADLSPGKLAEHYIDAFGSPEAAQQRLRLVIGVNLLDHPLNLKQDTPWHQRDVDQYVQNQAAKLPPIVALRGYLVRPTLEDGWRKRQIVTVDFVRQLSRLTKNVDYTYKAKFPFAGIRHDMVTNDVAVGFRKDLYKFNRNVFIHTGDSDLISLRPQGKDRPSLFQNYSAVIKDAEYQNEQGESTLARLGGSYTFSSKEIGELIDDRGAASNELEKKQMVQLSLLINAVDQEFRAIMASGNTPAGWFAEPNTLINAALLENTLIAQQISSSLSQEAASKQQMPDYFLALHDTLQKLNIKPSRAKDIFEKVRTNPALNAVPKRSLFLAGPEFRLVTSARHDVQSANFQQESKKILNDAKKKHNLQFRSSQASPLLATSYPGINAAQADQLFNRKANFIDLGTANKTSVNEIEAKLKIYDALKGLALKAIDEIKAGTWKTTELANLRNTIQKLLDDAKLSQGAKTGAAQEEVDEELRAALAASLLTGEPESQLTPDVQNFAQKFAEIIARTKFEELFGVLNELGSIANKLKAPGYVVANLLTSLFQRVVLEAPPKQAIGALGESITLLQQMQIGNNEFLNALVDAASRKLLQRDQGFSQSLSDLYKHFGFERPGFLIGKGEEEPEIFGAEGAPVSEAEMEAAGFAEAIAKADPRRLPEFFEPLVTQRFSKEVATQLLTNLIGLISKNSSGPEEAKAILIPNLQQIANEKLLGAEATKQALDAFVQPLLTSGIPQDQRQALTEVYLGAGLNPPEALTTSPEALTNLNAAVATAIVPSKQDSPQQGLTELDEFFLKDLPRTISTSPLSAIPGLLKSLSDLAGKLSEDRLLPLLTGLFQQAFNGVVRIERVVKELGKSLKDPAGKFKKEHLKQALDRVIGSLQLQEEDRQRLKTFYSQLGLTAPGTLG